MYSWCQNSIMWYNNEISWVHDKQLPIDDWSIKMKHTCIFIFDVYVCGT